MYDLRAILKRLKFPISTTLAGRSFHSRIILTKKEKWLDLVSFEANSKKSEKHEEHNEEVNFLYENNLP